MAALSEKDRLRREVGEHREGGVAIGVAGEGVDLIVVVGVQAGKGAVLQRRMLAMEMAEIRVEVTTRRGVPADGSRSKKASFRALPISWPL